MNFLSSEYLQNLTLCLTGFCILEKNACWKMNVSRKKMNHSGILSKHTVLKMLSKHYLALSP